MTVLILTSAPASSSPNDATKPRGAIFKAYPEFESNKQQVDDLNKRFGIKTMRTDEFGKYRYLFYTTPEKSNSSFLGMIQDGKLQMLKEFDWKMGDPFQTLPGMKFPTLYSVPLSSGPEDGTLLVFSYNQAGRSIVQYKTFAVLFNQKGEAIFEAKVGEANFVAEIHDKQKFLYLDVKGGVGWYRESKFNFTDLDGDGKNEIVTQEKKYLAKKGSQRMSVLVEQNFETTDSTLSVYQVDGSSDRFVPSKKLLDAASPAASKKTKALKWENVVQ